MRDAMQQVGGYLPGSSLLAHAASARPWLRHELGCARPRLETCRIRSNLIHSRPPSPILFPPPLLFPSLSLPFLSLPLYPPQTRYKRVEGMRSVAKLTIARP